MVDEDRYLCGASVNTSGDHTVYVGGTEQKSEDPNLQLAALVIALEEVDEQNKQMQIDALIGRQLLVREDLTNIDI